MDFVDFVFCHHFQKGSINSKTRWEKRFLMSSSDGNMRRQEMSENRRSCPLTRLIRLTQLTVSCLFCTTICVKTCRIIPKGWLSNLYFVQLFFQPKCTTIASSPNKRFRSATTDNYGSSTATSTKTTCKFKGGTTLPETNIAPIFPKRKGLSSKHQFSGANLVSGRVLLAPSRNSLQTINVNTTCVRSDRCKQIL